MLLLLWKPAGGLNVTFVIHGMGKISLAHPHDVQCYPMALPLVQVTEPVDAKWSWPL